MSTISNKFIVSSIDDGTTLHGELRVLGSVTQAWNGSSAIPDWSAVSNNKYTYAPLIYLTLMDGSSLVPPKANSFTWTYNGVSIEWGSTVVTRTIQNVSCSGVFSTNNLFFKTTYNVPTGVGSNTVAEPAIAIVGNLAASDNLDLDVITLSGAYTLGSADVGFSSSVNVRISVVQGNGYVGQIIFVNGVSDFTEDNQSIQAYAVLLNQDSELVSGYTVTWKLNGATVTTGTGQYTTGGKTYPSVTITDSQVVDYATLQCTFRYNNEDVAVDVVGIDDRHDPEYLFIQTDGANNSSASLHKNESLTFVAFVGKVDDPTPESGWSFDVLLTKADGTTITDDLSSYSIAAAAADGYRPMAAVSGNSNKAQVPISYALVTQKAQKTLTGYVRATK